MSKILCPFLYSMFHLSLKAQSIKFVYPTLSHLYILFFTTLVSIFFYNFGVYFFLLQHNLPNFNCVIDNFNLKKIILEFLTFHKFYVNIWRNEIVPVTKLACESADLIGRKNAGKISVQ